jgi:UDP-N-acetylglucosamine transferase subunit ALG13
MIFLAVGTQFPFDRLVKALDDCLDTGIIDEEIFGQIGETSYRPRNFKSAAFLNKKEFDQTLMNASRIIGHAGIGIMRTAMENNKPLLVMPRLRKYHEVVHDHQVEIARKFEKLGHILVAYSEQELSDKAQELKCFVPNKRETQIDSVVRRISEFLQQNNESPN